MSFSLVLSLLVRPTLSYSRVREVAESGFDYILLDVFITLTPRSIERISIADTYVLRAGGSLRSLYNQGRLAAIHVRRRTMNSSWPNHFGRHRGSHFL